MGFLRALGLALAALWSLTISIGLVVLLLVEPPKIPLLSKDGWQARGAFTRTSRPLPRELSRTVLVSPHSVFWRSWTPEAGSQPGLLVSAPFAATTWLAVPFAGYPADRGIELYLECLADARRLPIAQGNAHETWVERTLWLGPSWCPSHVRIVARSESRRSYVAVGTPFQSSLLSWLKESVFVVAVVHAIAWVQVLVPGLVGIWLYQRGRTSPFLLLAVPLTLFAGYAAFYVFYFGGARGRAAVSLLSLACTAIAAVRFRAFAAELLRAPAFPALAFCVVLSFFYEAALYAADVGAGSFAANYRFSPAVWSTDNQLPQVVAEALYNGRAPGGVLGGGWRVSDRPPLLTGLFLLGRPLWELLLAIGDNGRLAFLFYQSTGIVASTLWALPLGVLLHRALQTSREIALAMYLVATMGFVTFNSTYVWPKMLAGALGLGAYLAVLEARRRPARVATMIHALAGALAGLALVSHGGVVFGIAVLLLTAMWPPRLSQLRHIVALATTAFLITAPWMLWQQLVDPPGTALVKFALAGTFGMGEETKSVLSTVRDAYRQLTLDQWALSRWHALLILLGAERPPQILGMWTRPMDAVGSARLSDFLFVFPSLRIAGLGFIVLAVWAAMRTWRGYSMPPGATVAARWVGAGLGGIALNWMATWNMHILHHQSYLSLLLLVAGLWVAILLTPGWVRWPLICVHFTYFALVWVWSPLATMGVRLDVLVGWFLAGLALLVVSELVARREESLPTTCWPPLRVDDPGAGRG